MAKPRASKCPSCGANLPVQPGQTQTQCRFCGSVILIDPGRRPPPVPPGAPPRPHTVYINENAGPDGAQIAGRILLGTVIFVAIFVPVMISLVSDGCSCTSCIHPFPIHCGPNGDVTISGKTWEGNEPIVAEVGGNCSITIKDSHVKGTSFIGSDSGNLIVTLENTTIETTGQMFQASPSMRVHVTGGSLTSQGPILAGTSANEMDFTDTTVTSNATAFKTRLGLKVTAKNAKLHGKTAVFDGDSSLTLILKKGSEVAATEGPAIKGSHSIDLQADQATINNGVQGGSNTTIKGTHLTILSKSEKGIEGSGNLKIDLADSSITSTAEHAIFSDSDADVTLEGTTVQGAIGIETKSSLKLKATKKSKIVAVTGVGITSPSNADLTLDDSSVDAGLYGCKLSGVDHVKLTNARVAGKRGAFMVDTNFDINATNSTIDGGNGPGIFGIVNMQVVMQGGVLKGSPALLWEDAPPSPLVLSGTRIEGGQMQKPR